MAKIPKNLSDKDMYKGYQEEKSIEAAFMEGESQAETHERQRCAHKNRGRETDLEQAYLTPAIEKTLGHLLLELKMELYREGIVDYRIRVKREGKKILLVPVADKKEEK